LVRLHGERLQLVSLQDLHTLGDAQLQGRAQRVFVEWPKDSRESSTPDQLDPRLELQLALGDDVALDHGSHTVQNGRRSLGQGTRGPKPQSDRTSKSDALAQSKPFLSLTPLKHIPC